MLSIGFRVVGVGVVLEELSHVGHDGFLIWLVHVHIYRETQRRIHLDANLMTFYTKNEFIGTNRRNVSQALTFDRVLKI